jgi:hypothetical protein
MEPTKASRIPGAAFSVSTQRPTPKTHVNFGDVLSRTVAAGAQVAMSVVPGAPLMAFALRGGSGASMTGPAMPAFGSASAAAGAAPVGSASAEGPSAAAGGATGATTGAGGLESSLQQSQDMNLYYLQIQESVNAQNRSFTTLSNVMKAEHETVKTAIGNIR